MVKYAMLPNNIKMNTTTRNIGGKGTFLLDGGKGGQSSYRDMDDYIETTGITPSGKGLSDKIGSKLKNLNISSKPKRKNISFSV
jgi:hypothetical protein